MHPALDHLGRWGADGDRQREQAQAAGTRSAARQSRPFDPGREPAFLFFAPGDRIRLVPVSAADWPALDTEAQTGGTVARLVSE